MPKILIIIDGNLLSRIDEYSSTVGKSTGLGGNRSAFVREACEYYLTVKKGIPNILKRGGF